MAAMFRGEKIRLTPLRVSDAEAMSEWCTNEAFIRLYDSKFALPRTADSFRRELERDEIPHQEIDFAIRPLEADSLLGNIGLVDIEWSNRVAWLYIGLGDRSVWGKGIGSEAMRLFLTYVFNELNFHRIQLSVVSYNDAAIRMYERLGFVHEGVLREAGERDGKRYDLIVYGLLRREWVEKMTG